MQIRTSQTLPKKYNIFSRIDQLAPYGKEACILKVVENRRLGNDIINPESY